MKRRGGNVASLERSPTLMSAAGLVAPSSNLPECRHCSYQHWQRTAELKAGFPIEFGRFVHGKILTLPSFAAQKNPPKRVKFKAHENL